MHRCLKFLMVRLWICFVQLQPRRQLRVKSTVMMAADNEKRAPADVSSAQDSGEDGNETVLQSGNILGKLEMALYGQKEAH